MFSGVTALALGVFGQSKPHLEDTLGECPAACRATTVAVHAYAMVCLSARPRPQLPMSTKLPALYVAPLPF
jgi:hypothetical protein